MNAQGKNDPGDYLPSRFRDPENDCGALTSGRIGLVSWALVQRGDGHILTFRRFGRLLEIEIDTPAEQAAAKRLALAIIGAMPGTLHRAAKAGMGHGKVTLLNPDGLSTSEMDEHARIKAGRARHVPRAPRLDELDGDSDCQDYFTEAAEREERKW